MQKLRKIIEKKRDTENIDIQKNSNTKSKIQKLEKKSINVPSEIISNLDNIKFDINIISNIDNIKFDTNINSNKNDSKYMISIIHKPEPEQIQKWCEGLGGASNKDNSILFEFKEKNGDIIDNISMIYTSTYSVDIVNDNINHIFNVCNINWICNNNSNNKYKNKNIYLFPALYALIYNVKKFNCIFADVVDVTASLSSSIYGVKRHVANLGFKSMTNEYKCSHNHPQEYKKYTPTQYTNSIFDCIDTIKNKILDYNYLNNKCIHDYHDMNYDDIMKILNNSMNIIDDNINKYVENHPTSKKSSISENYIISEEQPTIKKYKLKKFI